MSSIKWLLLTLIIVACQLGTGWSWQAERILVSMGSAPRTELAAGKDVPFVPTPQSTVDEMLTMAKIGKNDVVYDLGSGDGRIVIAAAKEFGARGVGVDIDPERIAEAKENARKAGVQDQVKFVQGDLFDADIGDATVVTLYLLPSVNLRLRPKLLSDLRPGTRIVSHSFDMGEWKPEASSNSDRVYMWQVPANASGTWNVSLPDNGRATLALTQNFGELGGAMTVNGNKTSISNGEIKGETIRFTADLAGSGQTQFVGVVRGDSITGQPGSGAFGGSSGGWQASRQEGTKISLDAKGRGSM